MTSASLPDWIWLNFAVSFALIDDPIPASELSCIWLVFFFVLQITHKFLKLINFHSFEEKQKITTFLIYLLGMLKINLVYASFVTLFITIHDSSSNVNLSFFCQKFLGKLFWDCSPTEVVDISADEIWRFFV